MVSAILPDGLKGGMAAKGGIVFKVRKVGRLARSCTLKPGFSRRAGQNCPTLFLEEDTIFPPKEECSSR